MKRNAKTPLAFGLLVLFLLIPAMAHAEVTFTIINEDGPGEGFNDPTPADPVGGNPGTTLGQQRLIAAQFAADIWGFNLDSTVEIRLPITFDPLGPNVLGATGHFGFEANFPGAVFPDTNYHRALANKTAGFDITPGPGGDDFYMLLSSDFNFYLGLDNNHGTQIDLVVVLLHEYSHGLGFSSSTSSSSGAYFNGQPGVYDHFIHDNTLGLDWPQMTQAERQASAINWRNVVWDGPLVTEAVVSNIFLGRPGVIVNSPPSVAGFKDVGTAAFGPLPSSPGVTGMVALVNDGVIGGAGGGVTDACEPIPAGQVTGKIALVDRGFCTFVIKAATVQAAGAIGMIVGNNAPASPVTMGGADPTITITSVMILQSDRNAIVAALPLVVNATIGVDLSLYSATDTAGRMLLNTPNPVQPGSSVSHWDPVSIPNLSMEPAINGDLPHSLDLTVRQLADIGWFPTGRVNRKIAYNKWGFTGLFTANPDGTGEELLQPDGYNPSYSAHGQRLAFNRFAPGEAQIWAMNADGSGLRQLTSGHNDYNPVWSPDGNRIAFVRDTGSTAQNLRGNNRPPRQPLDAGTTDEGSGFDLWVMNVDGSNQTQLTLNNDGYTTNADPTWSPDSSAIIFRSDRTHAPYTVSLYFISVNNPGGETQLTFGGMDWDPDWSPDGRYIAFTSARGVSNRGQIWILELLSGNLTRLTFNSGFDTDTEWSPDFLKILFTSDQGGTRQLWTMNSDGSGLTPLTTGGGQKARPSWQGLP